MSNSAINKQIIAGSTGPIGVTGATGATGVTGSGGTGATGNYGKIITGASLLPSGAGIFFQLSDGTGVTVYGNFRGATSTEILTSAESVGDNGEDIFADITDGLISFKGISASGSLTSYVSGLTLYIDTLYSGGEGQLDVSVQDDKVMYLKDIDTASTTTISVVNDTSFDVLDFGKTASFINDQVIVNYYGPIERGQIVGTDGSLEGFSNGTTGGIVVDLSKAGVHYFRTPIGISEFKGEFSNTTTSSLLIFESDEVWKFPQNVYFPENENYLTCGKTFVSIKSRGKTSQSGTSIWLAKIVARGLDINFNGTSGGIGSEPAEVIRITDSCVSNTMVGSCCFLDNLGTQRCLEYKTKRDCDALFGVFNPNNNCNKSCPSSIGVCCSGGKCIENVTFDECQYFGGRYWSGITCGTYNNNPNGPGYGDPIQDGRLCLDTCTADRHACCKDGICLGTDFTRIECERILGGVSVKDTQCGQADCCLINIERGACCRPGSNPDCEENRTYKECVELKGVFMGPGESCPNVNCDCVEYKDPDTDYCDPVSKGACCYEDSNGNIFCTEISREACDVLDGEYSENKTCVEVDCEEIQPVPKGACCTPSASFSSICCTPKGCKNIQSVAQCDALDGVLTPNKKCCENLLTETQCQSRGGEYQGDYTDCSMLEVDGYNTCCYVEGPDNPGICCFENIETGARVCIERPDIDACENLDEAISGYRLVDTKQNSSCDADADWCKTPEDEDPEGPCDPKNPATATDPDCMYGCCCVFFNSLDVDIPYPGLFATHGYSGWYKGVPGQLPPGNLSQHFPSKKKCEEVYKGKFCGVGAVCPTYADLATSPGNKVGSTSPGNPGDSVLGSAGCCCPGHTNPGSFPTVPGLQESAAPFTYTGECKKGDGGGGGGTKWDCVEGKCVPAADGPYEFGSDCQAECEDDKEPPEPVQFACVEGTCVEDKDATICTSGFVESCFEDLATCRTNCDDGLPSWNWACYAGESKCLRSPIIPGTTFEVLADCISFCNPDAPPDGPSSDYYQDIKDFICAECCGGGEPCTSPYCDSIGCEYWNCNKDCGAGLTSLRFAVKDVTIIDRKYNILYKLFTYYIDGKKIEDCVPVVGDDPYIASLPACNKPTIIIQNPNTIGRCCTETLNKFTGKVGDGVNDPQCLACTQTTKSNCNNATWSSGTCTPGVPGCDACNSTGCCCMKDPNNPSAAAPYDRCSAQACRNCERRGGKWVSCASCGETTSEGAPCNCADLDWTNPNNPTLKPGFKPNPPLSPPKEKGSINLSTKRV